MTNSFNLAFRAFVEILRGASHAAGERTAGVFSCYRLSTKKMRGSVKSNIEGIVWSAVRTRFEQGRLSLMLIAVCGHSLISSAVADERNTGGGGIKPELAHGPPQVLAENLVRVRELETLLRAVEIESDNLFTEQSIESLLQIFRSPTDAFEIDPKSQAPQSIQKAAIRLLGQAPVAAQKQWMQATAVIAESQLRTAIGSGEQSEILRVSRQFPLTESGIKAAVLSISMWTLQGRDLEARHSLCRHWSDTAGTVLETYFRSMSKGLASQLSVECLPGATGVVNSDERSSSAIAAARSTQYSLSTAAAYGSLSPPWPSAKWKWVESVWTYPGVPQPQAGNALESLIPNTENTLNDFTNWKPVFWNGSLIHRSPFRIVAFDRNTGKEQWSLTTNTFTPTTTEAAPHRNEPDELAFNYGRMGDEPGFLGGLASFGLLSSDEEFIYFVDRFDFFRVESDSKVYSNRRRPGNRFGLPRQQLSEMPSTPVGTTLVALRRSPGGGLPTIAWTIGDFGNFRYELFQSHLNSGKASTVAEKPEKAIRIDQSDIESPNAETAPERPEVFPSVAGHRFLSPPIGKGGQLFVLTAHNDLTWLNCLTRGTGKVEWQQPLTFSDDLMNRYQEFANPSDHSCTCMLSNETVVCSLAAGLLIGVRAADGQLQWATAIREDIPQPQMQGFRVPFGDVDVDESIDSQCVIIPMCSDKIVVCTDAGSRRLHGINTSTGEIIWATSRRAFGPGDVGGSPDLYIAGISGSQVILVGERHCRSVDLATGDQNWVVPVMRTPGRAECRGDRCLIPQLDGQILTLDLKDGSVLKQRPSFLPQGAELQLGAITSDGEILCVSTPVSISVYPRSDAFSHHSDDPNQEASRGPDEILKLVQAHLINGDDQTAIALLQKASASAGLSGEDQRKPFDRYLGELILQDWALHLVAAKARPSSEDSPLINPERIALLPELELTNEQQLRAAVLTMLGGPETDVNLLELHELVKMQDWRTPVTITDDWSIRPDLLLNRSAFEVDPEKADFTKQTTLQRRRFAQDAILFPNLLKDDRQRQQFVNLLLTTGDFATAEMVAIAWQKLENSSQPKDVLIQIRERDSIGGYVESDVREQFIPSDLPNSSIPDPGLNSNSKAPLTIDSKPFLGVPDWDLQRVEKGLSISSLPDWLRLRFYLVDGRDGLPDLVSMDMSDGSLRDRVTLPFAFHRNTVNYRSLSNGVATPGLLPLAGAEQLAMISCSVPDKASLLWTRRLRKLDLEGHILEFGPLGADYFIWHYGDELHCSNPLTGQDLWVRKLRLSPVSRPIVGVRRIFGDEKAVIVMGTDLSSFERFNTRDGRSLGIGRLAIGRVSDAVTVGRCLLYPDNNSRLHMFDGATGLDALEDSDPVVLGRSNPDSMFQVLGEGRVVTVSSTFEIILIDTNSGRVVFRTPGASQVKTGVVFGLTAFERHGLLFVGLEEQRDFMIRSIEGAFRLREPRVHSGPLVCLDPSSGKIQWSMPLVSTSIPLLYGDPTDLMLMWSNPRSLDLQPEEEHGQKLNVQLINSQTGEVLAKETSISSSRPVRCVHQAVKKEIEIVTKDTRISIRADSLSSEPD